MAASDGKERDGKFWYKCLIGAAFDPIFSSRMREKFGPLQSGESQLKYHIKALRKMGALSLDVTSERVKNSEKAQEYRNNGNDLFSSDGDTAKVAEMYTQSIAYALPGSRELALAYANRSAVSFKAEEYENCLLDIERSLENDYPEEMIAKLFARRVRCLVALKKPQADVEKALEDTREALMKMDLKANGRNLIEKTLNDENHMAPKTSKKKTMKRLKPTIQDDNCDIRGATGISIQYSKKYGRHLIATRDIRPGEIIAVIDTYANAPIPAKFYRDCAQCTKPTKVGIPCDHCVNVIYCSTSCRDKAWNEYHEFECPILGIMLDLQLPQNAILCVKITLKAIKEAGGIIDLKKMLKKIDSRSDPRMRGFTGNVLDCTKYASIYTLTNHAGKHVDESYAISIISTFTTYYLATRTDILGQKYRPGLQVFEKNPLLNFLGDVMIRNGEIVHTTACGIDGGNYVQMAPFTALCNHSCDSNVIYVGTNKNMVFTLQPIKTGEQIFDSYGGLHYTNSPKAKRQKVLKDHFFFTCDCVACINSWPMLEELPSVFVQEMPGITITSRMLLAKLQRIYLEKYNSSLEDGDMLAAKAELVQLLELLYEHACPCKEILTYRESLLTMHDAGLDPF